MISLDKLDTIKITVNKDMTFNEIYGYLYPVRQYINEKFTDNMYDDWNELEHSVKWIKESLKSINENSGDILNIYCLYNKGNIKCGLKEVYIKSSHNKALNLYDKLGTVVGNYISISDHQLYQRYGYIYKIDL